MAIFADYAAFYDILYRDKDYARESLFVHGLLRRFHAAPRRLLDLACGTGRHVFELEKLGYLVEGADTSAAMIDQARDSARRVGSRAIFHHQSFQTADQIDGPFDAVISMFSAVGYLSTNEDFSLALRNVRTVLGPGGLLLFDYWNGAAVLRDYSPVKIVRKREGEREILRISETTLDPIRQIADVRFTCMSFLGDRKTSEFEELHRMRFFFFKEMEQLLAANHFKIVEMLPFLAADEPVRPYDWNITIVAAPSN